jgi:hypothetical protein
MGHDRNKQTTSPPPTRDLINTTKWVDQRTGAAVMAEAHTRSYLRTACTTVMRWTIAPKIVPSTLSQKEDGSRLSKSFAATCTQAS